MKNRKRLSILLVMAMVMTLLAGLAAPAGATPVAPFTVFGSGFTSVTVGTNRVGGTITVVEREATSWDAANRIHVRVQLPEGVTFNTRPTAGNVNSYVTLADAVYVANTFSFEESSDSMLRVSFQPATGQSTLATFNFNVPALSRLNIGAAVTGDIRAGVEVYALGAADAVLWIESDTRTIARVAPRAVTVTAAAARLVQMGNDRTAATITIAEGAPASLLGGTVPDRVYLDIITEGVTFFAAPALADSPATLAPANAALDGTRSVFFDIQAATTVFPGRIEITPRLNVSPAVTGDITIRVRSTTSGTALTTTTVTVATVGAVAVEVTGAANTDGTIFAGHPVRLLEVTGVGTARFNLRATGGGALPQPGIVVLALSNARFDTAVGQQFIVESRVGTGGWSTPHNPSVTLFNDNRSAWFETASWGGATELRIRDFRVAADADATAGELRVSVSGTLGATGDVVIGRIARPLSASGESVNLALPGLDQAAGTITITEAARGVMLAVEYRLELPEGLAFNNTTVRPRVRVTAGDLRVGDTVTVDGRQLRFTVTSTSTVPSTITVDRLQYDVHRASMEGNVIVRLREHLAASPWAGDNATLATAVNARVGVVAPPANVFTIGALSFVRAGVTTPITVAPTIVEGRTLLALRYAALAVGVSEEDIIWDGARRTVTVLRGDRVVQLRIGDRTMTINGAVVPLEVPAAISNGRIVLPIRAVATALRAGIVWDATARTITVTP